jgi:hypothetical protein
MTRCETVFTWPGKRSIAPRRASNLVREKFTFDELGNDYTGVWQAEFFDAPGNTVRTGSGTLEGTRIAVDPLDNN